ncbi:MAG TPA: hypothetical protein VJU87_07990 [Gemmatimonadaceae bacterium]|nr:hypothetical protein [Gemmatimonadaceae bacterium]
MSDGFLMGGQLGTISYFAQLDSGRTTLTILGRSFPLPTADSALVVLVDRADGVGGAPTIAGTAVIDGRFPADPVPKTWTSGDTIFTIRVPDRGNENLRMVLGRNPMAAAFWR